LIEQKKAGVAKRIVWKHLFQSRLFHSELQTEEVEYDAEEKLIGHLIK